MYPGIRLSKPYSNLKANLNANHESSQAPDITKKRYASVKSNLAAYRTETFTLKTRADVVKLMTHNLNSYGKTWTPKETAKAVKHGWDDGGITLRETFEVDGGSDYGGGGGGDGGDGGSVHETKEAEPGDFLSPIAPRERGAEDKEGEDEGEDEGEVADKEALETYARFKHQGFSFGSVPIPFEGETEGSAKNRLRTFVRTLHDKGIILQRFKVSVKKPFEFSRNRLIMVRLGGRISAAAPAAAAPPTVAAPAARALSPEVGGSPGRFAHAGGLI
jgi:hypothetical protein